MITVTVRYQTGKPVGFCVSGHAGFAPAGEDILCAAVSSAVQLCVNSVQAFVPCVLTSDEQTAQVNLQLEKPDETAQTLLHCFEEHIRALTEQFAQHLTLHTREE